MLNFSKLENIIRKSLVGTGIVLGSYACAGDWNYTEDYSLGYDKLSLSDIVSLGIPIGNPETEKDKYFRFVKQFQKKIIQGLTDRGYGLDSGLSAKFYSQLYALPTNKKIAEEYLNYCKKAKEFMYSKLGVLKEINPKWIILEKGMDFKENCKESIFIADGYSVLSRAEFYKEDNLVFSIRAKEPYAKGSSVIFEKGNFNDWHIVLSMNFNNLSAPFAEILHLTTAPISCKSYEDFDKATNAEETLNNALAYYLTLEVAEELKISLKTDNIKANFLKMAPLQYKYVAEAIEYMKGKDINNIFQSYISNPKACIKEITGLDNLE